MAGVSQVMDCNTCGAGQCGNVEFKVRILGKAVLGATILLESIHAINFIERRVPNSKECSVVWKSRWETNKAPIRLWVPLRSKFKRILKTQLGVAKACLGFQNVLACLVLLRRMYEKKKSPQLEVSYNFSFLIIVFDWISFFDAALAKCNFLANIYSYIHEFKVVIKAEYITVVCLVFVVILNLVVLITFF